MKKIKNSIILIFALLMLLVVSCEDFLNRPDKANYTLANFYKNDEQCLQAVNPLYTVPWFDFFRGWLRVGDCQSGNYYIEGNGFWMLTPNDDMEEVKSMSASLWAVNARANTVLENINLYAGAQTTELGRNTAKGEALVWKALSYFFMVRIYGAVPIIHNNTELMNSGEYNSLYRAKIENVYEYIIMTLEQAVKWLPENNEKGRLDKYSAYGLLAKVYLTRSGYGQSGNRNSSDLELAKEYARKVVRESGRELTFEYSDIFRGSHNADGESLIAWRWVTAADNYWTAQNDLQSDLTPSGFAEGDAWGSWTGPSLDLQEAFGEKFNGTSPSGALSPTRNNVDKRRKSTMMMYGDVYSYFWRNNPVKKDADNNDVAFPNGFDFSRFYGTLLKDFHSSTGANVVKHVVGNNADHIGEFGVPMIGRGTSLATHILRLADVYLIYAEAVLGNAESTSDAEALWAYNEVRKRAGVSTKSSITWRDIFLERRLELAFEGDFWYDIVRWHYYEPDKALAYLNGQNRKTYTGLSGYYLDQGWNTWGKEGGYPKVDQETGELSPRIDIERPDGKPYTHDKFTMPFPSTDLQMNPNLSKDPIDYDVSQYTYE
ncbi:MAG: RagB/SusD family nutrient uptake outer membrane protein [Proteiniphilum sp.]|nr:RagB/SusD family nutrient uptake outer membrane protein [Proteiniphilum sp.]